MMNDILDLMRVRHSGRAYDPNRSVSEADLAAMLEAARWAPSGGNGQPWRFKIARHGTPEFEAMHATLAAGNKDWAKHASLLVLTAAEVRRMNAKGELTENRTAFFDVGMANFALNLEAVRRGLIVHFIGGFDVAAAQQWLPEHVVPVCMLTIGYEGDGALLSDSLREREKAPRTRKELDSLLIHS